MSFYEDFTLLIDGEQAFPEIIACIDAAKESVLINMFIWRDDEIGNRMATAVLSAAERGVKVTLSIDRYGVVLEKSEESRRSFFHKSQTVSERFKSGALSLFYPMKGAPRRARDEQTALYQRICAHPNITLDCDRFKADHSKYYVIDGEILFIGGINVEDKENGADMQGRVYQDYMIKMNGRVYVDALQKKLETGENVAADYFFGINRKALPLFEMEALYLNLIHEAREELHVNMAYFSPLTSFLDAIEAAYLRGVRVTVMIPEHANYQDATNRRAVRELMRRTNNGITLYFTPKMAHTKLIASEREISLGSTNITKKAFAQLDELNLFLHREDCAICDRLITNIKREYAQAKRIASYEEIKYNRIYAFLEGFLV